MKIVKSSLFHVLNDEKVQNTLAKLYTEALKQSWSLLPVFVPHIFKLLSKNGADWKRFDERKFDDKYIPIDPSQGEFLYLLARSKNAKNMVEFGTSYGISTIYLAKAAQQNGGKVISTEYLSEKVKKANLNIAEAGLSEYVQILEGDAQETLKNIEGEIDFVLLDGWPDLVFSVFKILEPKLSKNAVILVDDVNGFQSSMKDYLDYVRNPKNGYISSTLKLKKNLEYTMKI